MDRCTSRLAAQGGFGVIEVIVSALIVVLLSLATFAAIDAAGRTADTNKERSQAANLAQSDQERLRGLTVAQLTGLDQTCTGTMTGQTPPCLAATVDNNVYTVRSQGEYQLGSSTTTSCSSDENAPRYLRMTSSVTWNDMRGAKPVKQVSLRAMPSGTTTTKGSIAVSVVNRTGAGLAGTAVSIAGPTTQTVTTNAAGCAVFGFVPVGTYTVSFARSGYVEAPSPNRASISDSLVVSANSIASKSYQYDQAGAVTANYVTSKTFTDGTSTPVAAIGTEFSIANAGLGTPSFKISPTHAGATTSPALGGNFPFTGNYEAWSGDCAASRPSSGVGSVAVTPAGSATVAVREYRLRLQVQRRTNATTTATNNYAVMSNDSKSAVKLISANGCTADTAASWVSNTTASGNTNGNYSTYEAILPWGSDYKVCAAYNDTNIHGRDNSTYTNIAANGWPGSTYGTKVVVPYGTGSVNLTC